MKKKPAGYFRVFYVFSRAGHNVDGLSRAHLVAQKRQQKNINFGKFTSIKLTLKAWLLMKLGCLNFSNMMMLWLCTVLKNTKLSAMQRQLEIYYNTFFCYNRCNHSCFLLFSYQLLFLINNRRLLKNILKYFNPSFFIWEL